MRIGLYCFLLSVASGNHQCAFTHIKFGLKSFEALNWGEMSVNVLWGEQRLFNFIIDWFR